MYKKVLIIKSYLDYCTNEYFQLSDNEKFYIRRKLEVLKEIIELKKSLGFMASIKAVADKIKNEKSKIRGFSAKSLQRDYYKMQQKDGDWRCLIRKYRGGNPGFPKSFLICLKGYISRLPLSKSNKDIIMEIKAKWLNNEFIEGYGIPKEWIEDNMWIGSWFVEENDIFPKGWSTRNLSRIIQKYRKDTKYTNILRLEREEKSLIKSKLEIDEDLRKIKDEILKLRDL